MVVFTCNHCGESLQKPRVEKHYSIQCRRPKSLTCVDCFKDFKNEEYTVHTKCITEEERYSAKGSIPGGVIKKGDVKQDSWTDMIRSIVQTEQNMNTSLKNLFSTISNYSNVPRKKAKFINFLKSSTGGRVNFSDIEAAWDLIEKYKNEQKKNNNLQNTQKLEDHIENEVNHNIDGLKENGTKHKIDDGGEAPAKKKKKVKHEPQVDMEVKTEVEENGMKHNINDNEGVPTKKKKKSKKPKVETEVKENGTNHKNSDAEAPVEEKLKQPQIEVNINDESNKFSFKETILSILNSKGTISCKKLQKKVLAAYLKETGNSEYTEKTIKKYNKKLKKLSNVTIQDDTVSLIANSEQ